MTITVENLLEQTTLPFLLQEVNQKLQDEAIRRQEFYKIVTEDRKIEFINGEIIIQSPAKLMHIEVSDRLHNLLSVHVDLYGLGKVTHEKLMVSLTRNDFEPDICFFRTERCATFHGDQMRFPAPDFVVEVLSRSTAGRDRKIKKSDYELHGVAEYWIIHPKRHFIEQYVLQEGKYVLLAKHKTGKVISQAVAGFELEVEELFDYHRYQQRIERDKKEIVRLNHEIKAKDNEIEKHKNQLVEQQSQLAEKDNLLVEQQSQLVEKDNLLVEQQSQLVEQQSQLQEQKNQLAD